MQVEAFSWYQWLLIGVCTGAVLGFVHVATAPDPEDTLARTVGQEEFEAALLESTVDGEPALRHVVIHPKDARNCYWITGLRRTQVRLHADGVDPSSPMVNAVVTTPFKFSAPAVYCPLWGTDRDSGSVRKVGDAERPHALLTTPFAFLDQIRKLSPATAPAYRYAWFDSPVMCWAAWTTGSAVVVGGVWPLILRFLLCMGLGRKNPEVLLDLTSFGTGNATSMLKPAMQSFVLKSKDGADHETCTGAQAVEVLDPCSPTHSISTLFLDQPPILREMQSIEPKDYDGEFYPTVVHRPRGNATS